MKKTLRCCFSGHNEIYDNEVKIKIKNIADRLITEHNVSEFWVGNYGSFDNCAGQAIRELKKIYSHIELDIVIPYLTKSITDYRSLYYENFDNILIADIPINTPKKFCIIKANEYMVDNSDFMICYVEQMWGGAIKTFNYAKRKKIQVINIASNPINL